MNTRSRPTAGEVRDRLLAAAEQLLADRRPAAITSRDIARAADLSDGVLYNHFADKNELLLAALVRRFDRITAAYGEQQPPADDAADARLIEVVRRAHAVQLAVLPMLANLVGDPPLLDRFLTEIHRAPLGGPRFHEPIRSFLAAEQDAGRLGSFDLDGATDAIVGTALFAGLLGILGHHPPHALEERLEAFARTLLTGLQNGGTSR